MKKNIPLKSNAAKKSVNEPIKQAKPPKDLSWWIAGAVFTLTTVFFFWNIIFGKFYFWDDFVRFVYPVQSYAAKIFASGAIPFWNPYSFSGMPFLADLQTGFFYLPNRLLSLFLDNTGSLSVGALQLLIILHFIIAQFSFYKLSQYLKISSFGAILGAVSYSFSMFMICHVFHPMMIFHLAWFPLVIMFFLKGLNEKSYKFSIIAGLIFGGSILSGHPQTTLYEGFFLAAIFLWFLIAELKSKSMKGLDSINYIIRGALPVLIGAGLFCVQYLPSTELARLSDRDENTYSKAGEGFVADMKYEKATEGSLKLKQVFASVTPKIFGYVDGSGKSKAPFWLSFKSVEVQGTGQPGSPYNISANESPQSHFFWETAYYFGLAALILGIFGAAITYRTRMGMFLIVISILSFLFALGENSFIFDIFYAMPLFGTFRNPSRMMLCVTIAFSLLAGFGFDALWQKAGDKKSLLILLAIAGIVIFISILASAGVLPEMLGAPEETIKYLKPFGTAALVISLIVTAISVLLNKRIIPAAAAGAILIFVAYIDLYMTGSSFNESPQNPLETYKVDADLRDMLTPKPPQDIFRVNMRKYRPRIAGVMEDNQGMIDNIMLIEGYNPLRLQRRRPPMPVSADYLADERKFFDFFNVKYEIGIDSVRLIPAFFERTTYLPRAYAVRNIHVVPEDKIEAEMQNKSYDFSQEAVLEKNPNLSITRIADSTKTDKIECIEYQPNVLKYKVNLKENALIVFSEIWYPAWKAYIDGSESEIFRANYCLRSVAVQAGAHTIEMRYESESFGTGLTISLITLFISLGGLVFFIIFNKPKPDFNKSKPDITNVDNNI